MSAPRDYSSVLPLIRSPTPNNVDAERALLAGLLQGVVIPQELNVRAQHFVKPDYGNVFEAMLSLPIVDEILIKERIDEVWWPPLLTELSKHPPVARNNALSYADEVRELWVRRQILEHNDEVRLAAMDVGRKVGDLLSMVSTYPQPDIGSSRFNLISFEDATNGMAPEPKWQVHNLIHECDFVVVYSETKAGKTLVAIDLGCRIANGYRWHKLKTKKGIVVHLILEGQGLFDSRLRAWKALYGNAPGYFYMPLPVHFLEEADISSLIADIRKQVGGEPIAMVVVDTVNRALGGGNENSPEDMGAFVAACDRIRHELMCTVLALHHCGHDKSHSRGHTSLIGAADLVMKVTKEGDVRRITIDHARHGADDLEFGFKLALVDLDNGRVEAAVADLAGGLPKAAPKLSANQKKCLEVLRQELRRYGRYDIGKEFDEIPAGTKFVDEKKWKDVCTGPKHAIAESTYRLCLTQLESKGVVGKLYSVVWIL